MADPGIRFYDPRDAETGWLANFYHYPFRYEGSDYPTVEHCYQAQKLYACTGVDANTNDFGRFVGTISISSMKRLRKVASMSWSGWVPTAM